MIIGGLLFMILAAIFAALFGDHLLAMLRDKQELSAMNDVDHAALDEELAEIVTGIEQERIKTLTSQVPWWKDPTEQMTQMEWNSFTHPASEAPVEEVIDLTEEVPLDKEEAVEMALNTTTDEQIEAIVDSVYEEEKEKESYESGE